MSVSMKSNQCTLFVRLDEEAYAAQSGQAYEAAEAAAAETDAYPVVYPEPYNSMGCGYGRLSRCTVGRVRNTKRSSNNLATGFNRLLVGS